MPKDLPFIDLDDMKQSFRNSIYRLNKLMANDQMKESSEACFSRFDIRFKPRIKFSEDGTLQYAFLSDLRLNPDKYDFYIKKHKADIIGRVNQILNNFDVFYKNFRKSNDLNYILNHFESLENYMKGDTPAYSLRLTNSDRLIVKMNVHANILYVNQLIAHYDDPPKDIVTELLVDAFDMEWSGKDFLKYVEKIQDKFN